MAIKAIRKHQGASSIPFFYLNCMDNSSISISFPLLCFIFHKDSDNKIAHTPAEERHFLLFLISNFRRVLDAICFLLGNSLSSEFYMSTFRYTLCSMEHTECSEVLAYKIQKPGNYPEESTELLVVFHNYTNIQNLVSLAILV